MGNAVPVIARGRPGDRLAQQLGQRRSWKGASPIVQVPYNEAYPPGFEDMQRRVPDVTKLERTIGFRPRTPLASIIADVVADQRARAEVAA